MQQGTACKGNHGGAYIHTRNVKSWIGSCHCLRPTARTTGNLQDSFHLLKVPLTQAWQESSQGPNKKLCFIDKARYLYKSVMSGQALFGRSFVGVNAHIRKIPSAYLHFFWSIRQNHPLLALFFLHYVRLEHFSFGKTLFTLLVEKVRTRITVCHDIENL
jgi:hypothetical protein